MWSLGLGCEGEDGREHRARSTAAPRTAHAPRTWATWGSTWRGKGHHRSLGRLSSCVFPRASVWRFPRTLCQRRHLPEATSGTRNLPVSVVRGSGNGEEEEGEQERARGVRKGGKTQVEAEEEGEQEEGPLA